MKQKTERRYRDRCPICKHKGIKFTSSPIDGRALLMCDQCGNTWSEGRKPNEGYQRAKVDSKA